MITIDIHFESIFAAQCNYLPKIMMPKTFCPCVCIYIYIYICIYMYIRTRPKWLRHNVFGKIFALGSKNRFKMDDYCYYMLDGVSLNISRYVSNHWPISALWSIYIISTQYRGIENPLFNFVCNLSDSWTSFIYFDYA